MKNPEKVPFIGMLETFLDRRLLSPEQDALDAAYEDYVDMLHSLTARSLRPPLDLLHDLARLQSRLMRSQARIVEKESPQASLLESALLLTNFEIRLVFTRLRYPSIADPVSVEVPKSPLYLSKEFTPTDLMELIAALQISGAVRRIDGSPADLPTLVEVLQCADQQSGAVPPCRHKPQTAADTFSGSSAQPPDRVQPPLTGRPSRAFFMRADWAGQERTSAGFQVKKDYFRLSKS